MPSKTLCLNNQQTRRLWLHLQGLLTTPHNTQSKQTVLDTVRQLGMVQLDSIDNVARAHHHIIWSRHTSYHQDDYNALLSPEPSVFEHFSHDAVILPMDIYPLWRRQCQRRSDVYKRGALGKQLGSAKVQKQILSRISKTGPMCSRDFSDTHKQRADKSVHAWMRPPHKLALDYLWLAGELCVTHRKGFIKYYDLAYRHLSSDVLSRSYNDAEQVDFLCHSALQRLGFATAKEIQSFYDACDLAEVKHWLEHNVERICEITIECHDGTRLQRYAPADIATTVKTLPVPCRRMRIVNPFDPVIRDRTRLNQLFGIHYRIEIYTPAAQRQYGYYVYPILEADQIVARIDVGADRKRDILDVKAWWLEPGVKHNKGRTQRLSHELKRLARLANVTNVSEIPPPSAHPQK